MRTADIRPTGIEHRLGQEQIIVSKTDAKGVLTYINDVFIDISRYTEAELIGQPHNIVRHPDTPRCIFKLLWDTISSGKEMFAYLDNLSKDGGHYWVLAHVTPTFSAAGTIVGYHSNRRAPAPEAVAQIRPLYASLLAAEKAAGSTPAALAAGTALLQKTLDAQRVTYDELVWNLTNNALAGAR